MRNELAQLRRTYIGMIMDSAKMKNRVMAMPMTYRYCTDIDAVLGYDQWALWLALVEVMWLHTLDHRGFAKCAPDMGDVAKLFNDLTTVKQDKVEKETIHDILALRKIMSGYFPPDVAKYLHFGLTSYDAIDTARALMFNQAYHLFIKPDILELDKIWREKIAEYADIVQIGRTHLQHALPITVGNWLAVIHDRFYNNAMALNESGRNITGKISGAVGNSSALFALDIEPGAPYDVKDRLEVSFLMSALGLGCPALSTQIVQPEFMARHLHDYVLLSGSLAQLGNDVRILQSSDIGEIASASSKSSTMAHKRGNPIVAENIVGMFTTIQAEYMKCFLNLTSNLQRDLTGSGPARDFIAVPAYMHRQLKNAIRLFKSIKVDVDACRNNLGKSAYLTMAELLHLELMQHGIADSHQFVNEEIVPLSVRSGKSLDESMEHFMSEPKNLDRHDVKKAWIKIPQSSKVLLKHPEHYLGLSGEITDRQAHHDLASFIR